MEITPELVEQITRQVMQQMGGGAAKPRALFFGEPDRAGRLAEQYRLDFAGQGSDADLAPCELVIVGQLTTGQLADIAAGRDDTPLSCAVTTSLLTGRPVYLLPEALPHRRHQATANAALYRVLEGYVAQLEDFGVRLCAPCREAEPQQEQAGSGWDFGPGLLTAEQAKQLAGQAAGTLRFARGTIITPLARDVLRAKRMQIQMGQ